MRFKGDDDDDNERVLENIIFVKYVLHHIFQIILIITTQKDVALYSNVKQVYHNVHASI